MEGIVKKETHYDCDVWVNTKTEAVRRDECLCFNCGEMGCCEIAARFYELCVEFETALIMTRCREWRPNKKGE